jgi:hypothetical protein
MVASLDGYFVNVLTIVAVGRRVISNQMATGPASGHLTIAYAVSVERSINECGWPLKPPAPLVVVHRHWICNSEIAAKTGLSCDSENPASSKNAFKYKVGKKSEQRVVVIQTRGSQSTFQLVT